MSGVVTSELLTTTSILLAVAASLHSQNGTHIKEAIDIQITLSDRERDLSTVNRALAMRALPLLLLSLAVTAITIPTFCSILHAIATNWGGAYSPSDAAFLVVVVLLSYFTGISAWNLASLWKKRRRFRS